MAQPARVVRGYDSACVRAGDGDITAQRTAPGTDRVGMPAAPRSTPGHAVPDRPAAAARGKSDGLRGRERRDAFVLQQDDDWTAGPDVRHLRPSVRGHGVRVQSVYGYPEGLSAVHH